ncbi:CCA tRNA nucleotidyltransferase [Novosphingobium sp. P6W]|uniref:CCA tRNA nucleotidyltransferase n=1 Tax=Novosphingobium sp. P6W TaxID=1609758 RepID=UPI0005C2AF46|nr:CCA tRNA nucleotidyltransferase [Novosphingobium sp. P6W]AXB76840.1 CCA tRNA nucleotidyltransferase [Novosphingobium sp. P6W]KIS33312.1 polynucleotide adenylyltransferase [Novosphingobium sp. P6W]
MTDTLDAPWMHREDIAGLVAALGHDNVRYVGGAVRDTLLGLSVKDIDMATVLHPQAVIERLTAAGIRSVPTGIEHGTVTAVLPGGPVEITTLRHDVSTDGRRATVAFAQDWREDAARRDFTINALYADPLTGELFDWFGGREDLEARRVRFIGDARQRIREDHLRILRYFRFQARFGGSPADEEAESACAELAATLKGLSRERVGMETMNLLGLPDPAPTVRRMAELGVLAVILPEADPESLAALVAAETAQGHAPDPVRRLAALLPAQPALAEQVAARFRLSAAHKKRLSLAAARDGAPGDARALAYRLGRESALDRLLIAGADAAALNGWDIPQLPLKGGQIVARGTTAGPEVARILQEVKDAWIEEGFPDEVRVEALLDAVLAARPA